MPPLLFGLSVISASPSSHCGVTLCNLSGAAPTYAGLVKVTTTGAPHTEGRPPLREPSSLDGELSSDSFFAGRGLTKTAGPPSKGRLSDQITRNIPDVIPMTGEWTLDFNGRGQKQVAATTRSGRKVGEEEEEDQGEGRAE